MARSTRDPIRRSLPRARNADPPAEKLLKGSRSRGASVGREAGNLGTESSRPDTLLRAIGPGLITGASDDDPSGIGTYAQVGAQYGTGLLWMAAFTFPLMSAVQELCARIALHTGVGLGVSLRRKFPTWLVGLCIGALLIANTINLGADLGAVAAGGELLSRGHISAAWLIIPTAAIIVGLQLFASYAVIFKVFKYLTLALFAYVITAFIAHPSLGETLRATVVPHVQIDAGFITAVVAVLGTTISPYLFFWQASSEVDEMKATGKTSRQARRGVSRTELRAARFDVLVGMAFSQIVMYAIILTSSAVLNAHGKTDVQTAQDAAAALEPLAGPFAFIVFATGIIGTGLLAIPILSGSAAYALKEFAGFSGSLAVKARYRPTFYVVIILATLAGTVLNFAHVNPISALFITAVINGVVAPPLLILIILLGSDRAVMKSMASGRVSRALTWVAAATMTVAAVAMGVLSLQSHG